MKKIAVLDGGCIYSGYQLSVPVKTTHYTSSEIWFSPRDSGAYRMYAKQISASPEVVEASSIQGALRGLGYELVKEGKST